MRGLDRRLTAVEAKQAPACRIVVYTESPRGNGDGRFVRTNPADPASRRMTRAEAVADAGANATCIFVVYESPLSNRGNLL